MTSKFMIHVIRFLPKFYLLINRSDRGQSLRYLMYNGGILNNSKSFLK